MIGARKAPAIPARDSLGADAQRDVAGAEATVWIERMPSAPATASRGNDWPRASRMSGVRVSHDPASSETVSMQKPPTGEPYAGKPPVRFGGRGGDEPSLPLSGGGCGMSTPTAEHVAVIVAGIPSTRLAPNFRHGREGGHPSRVKVGYGQNSIRLHRLFDFRPIAQADGCLGARLRGHDEIMGIV